MKTVAVWKRVWLPPSETFVRNQMDNLADWRSIAFGVRRTESILARETDTILFGEGIRERFALALFRLRGHSPRVTRFLQDQQVDVVHAHFGSEAVSIWRQCRKVGIPLVVTLHGHDISAGPSTPGFAGWRYRRRLRAMFGYASRVIAVSNFIRQLAIERGADESRVSVRYIGIPVDDVEQAPAASGFPKWDVVFVGRLTHKKGAQDLLSALADLEAEGTSVSAVVAGSGPLAEALQRFANENGLRVDFLGHQSPAQVRTVLRESRLFVAPSKTAEDGDAEGFGLVFLEAAAAGLPVVSYRHGGVAEAVSDGVTGILCAEGDVDELARAIRSLLEDERLAAAMGTAGRARVAREFDVRQRSRELEMEYDASLRDSRAR